MNELGLRKADEKPQLKDRFLRSDLANHST
jgi:hypothetical protein